MVRLKDIALKAGVSVMTVSKVLRDAPDISNTTKARIKILAQEMGYVPDSMAQGLRTRTTKLLGLVVPSVTNAIFARTILAIEENAYEWGYDIIIAQSLNDPSREEAVIRRMLSRRVDAFLVSPVYRLAPSSPIYLELANSLTPTVILGPKANFCSQFPNVETDDIKGSYLAAQHLIAIGHRKIAYFSGPTAAPWAQDRLEGYRRALREANIEPDDRLIFHAGSSIEDGGKAALQFLNEGTRVTAIMTANDMVAIGAANLLLNQGVRIPGHISLVGFGNILLGENYRIPLTTVRQPKYALGLAAMEILKKLLRHEPAESKRLSTELLVRSSAASIEPPRSAMVEQPLRAPVHA